MKYSFLPVEIVLCILVNKLDLYNRDHEFDFLYDVTVLFTVTIAFQQ